MPKSNSQQKSTPDACIRHQQVGVERRGAPALLRVRTGPKALRAIGGSFFKLWDSKRENYLAGTHRRLFAKQRD